MYISLYIYYIYINIYNFNNETFRILFYFDFLQILHGLTMKPKCKNYILD